MRDYYRTAEVGFRQEAKERREKNRKSSISILQVYGVEFERKNGDVHLIVAHGERVIDFWPSTGKFIERKSGRAGRGVFNLLHKVLHLKPLSVSEPRHDAAPGQP